MTRYLGLPKNETEWLKYQGTCVIFSGNVKETDEYGCDIWIMETEEETVRKLINGLDTVGVKCDFITILWTDVTFGTRCCKCVCYYNKPYEIYYSDFFIKGLSNYEFGDELEFGFDIQL